MSVEADTPLVKVEIRLRLAHYFLPRSYHAAFQFLKLRERTYKSGGDRERREGDVSMLYRYLLIVRFTLVNLVAVALTAAAYLQGWLDGLFTATFRELSAVIFLVFFYGLVLCGARIWRHGIELNDVKGGTLEPGSRIAKFLEQTRGADSPSRSIQMDSLRLKLTDRIVRVRHIANSLVFLGLIGTVIGFIIALSGVDPVAATDSENVADMISTLISGMSVALYTTLIGSVLYVWLIVNY